VIERSPKRYLSRKSASYSTPDLAHGAYRYLASVVEEASELGGLTRESNT
jgi:hypothetical protein